MWAVCKLRVPAVVCDEHCFVSIISTIMHIIILFKIIQLCIQ